MRLICPIEGQTPYRPLSPSSQYISQWFGDVWIADRDMVVGGKEIKKGDNVYLKVFGMIGHNGVDIVANKYTPTRACHSSYVIEANSGSGFGTRVSLYWEADGFQWVSVYGHLDNYIPLAKIPYDFKYRGRYVAQGEKVGEVDSTGFSTGNHLHWGLYQYKNGIKLNTDNGYQGAVDPWQYVKEHYMEIFQIEGEKTLVVKNMDGKFYYLATDLELYPYVAQILGIKDKNFSVIKKTEVDANLGGELKAGLTFVSK